MRKSGDGGSTGTVTSHPLKRSSVEAHSDPLTAHAVAEAVLAERARAVGIVAAGEALRRVVMVGRCIAAGLTVEAARGLMIATASEDAAASCVAAAENAASTATLLTRDLAERVEQRVLDALEALNALAERLHKLGPVEYAQEKPAGKSGDRGAAAA